MLRNVHKFRSQVAELVWTVHSQSEDSSNINITYCQEKPCFRRYLGKTHQMMFQLEQTESASSKWRARTKSNAMIQNPSKRFPKRRQHSVLVLAN